MKKNTFEYYSLLYEERIKDKSTKTISLVRYILKKHLLPEFGNKFLKSVTLFDFKNYVTKKSKKYKVYNHMKYFRAVVGIAREQGQILIDFKMECPDLISENHKVYSPIEIASLLRGCRARDQWNLRLQIYIAWTMGLRKSEVLGLKWDFINLSTGLLSLPANFQKRTKRTKRHEMPINRLVLRVLRARQARGARSVYLFPVKAKRVGPQTDLDRSWSRLLERVGVTGTFHSLRGTCASQLCNAGIQVPIVCKLLRMTEAVLRRHYLEIDMPMARFAIDFAGKIKRMKAVEKITLSQILKKAA